MTAKQRTRKATPKQSRKPARETNVKVWPNARADVFYYDGEADVAVPCEVKIGPDSVVISYQGEEGWVNYTGKNDGSGHFELRADLYDGRSSIHMFPESNFLEGFWIEERERGMWRIALQP